MGVLIGHLMFVSLCTVYFMSIRIIKYWSVLWCKVGAQQLFLNERMAWVKFKISRLKEYKRENTSADEKAMSS